MSDPSGWIREPRATSWSASSSTSSGIWSGGVAMSASAKTIRSPSAASMPARTAAPLPAVRDPEHVQSHVADGSRRLGSRLDDGDGLVRAAVVDDEDVDLLREVGRPGRPVARLVGPAAEVAEQLVERRADPFGLVEGGEDEREAHRPRPLGRPDPSRGPTSVPSMADRLPRGPRAGFPRASHSDRDHGAIARGRPHR